MRKKLLAAALALSMVSGAMPVMAAETTYTATPSKNPIYCQEELVDDIPVYSLFDNNYFRLRDIAQLMDFAVVWNAEQNCIEIKTDTGYGEAEAGLGAATQNKTAVASPQTVYIDGEKVEGMTVYSIDGYNYFRLRDLAESVDFGCVYDAGKNSVVLDAGYGYMPDNTYGPAKNEQSQETEKPEETKSMAINTELLALDVGDSYQLSVSDAPGAVTWSTEDAGIVTVDTNGRVTAVAAGNAAVTATSGEQTVSCEVVVSEKAGLKLDAAQLILEIDDIYTLTANMEDVTWSSSNEKVATVDENGKILAVGTGETTITAKAQGQTAQCKVEVPVDTSIEPELDVNTLTLEVGESKQLTANVYGVKWESTDESVASVEDGLVTGIAQGSAQIIVTYGNKTTMCAVTVNDVQQEQEEEEQEQQEETAAPAAISEEEVYSIIMALKADYPEGMKWNNDDLYISQALRINGYGCAGFALICSDAAFGDLPATRHENFDAIRVGDMVRIGDYHSVVVLEKKSDSIIVAEGNYNNAIHWGREITRDSLEEQGFYVDTRYPA